MDNEVNEMQGMTDEQYEGVIRLIIELIKTEETKEELIRKVSLLIEK
ncbi:MAG: hypothetical protein Q4G11_05600 [Gallicola sp.]|nr:hypothetical protein [Gallicola sp.]